MADNLTTQEGVGGPVVATNEIAGVHYARSKIGHGEPGTYGDTSAANPLPVAATSLPLPTGAATQASPAANTAMADALAKVSDGIAQMRAKRDAEDADDLTGLLLILAEV